MRYGDSDNTTTKTECIRFDDGGFGFPISIGSRCHTIIKRFEKKGHLVLPLPTVERSKPCRHNQGTNVDILQPMKRPSRFIHNKGISLINGMDIRLPAAAGRKTNKEEIGNTDEPILWFRQVVELPEWLHGEREKIEGILEQWWKWKNDRHATHETNQKVIPWTALCRLLSKSH